MRTHEGDRFCAGVVEKVIAGKRLDESEKEHLASCEGCMEELVTKLDEADIQETTKPSGNDDHSQRRPEVEQALENARRVFSREFGISISDK